MLSPRLTGAVPVGGSQSPGRDPQEREAKPFRRVNCVMRSRGRDAVPGFSP